MSGPTPEPGCYVDSHWGQYAIARAVQVAAELGRHAAGDDELAARHLAAMGPSTEPGLDDDESERLVDAADRAENWLNEHRAPEGYAWGWNDGDFGLYALEDGGWQMPEFAPMYAVSAVAPSGRQIPTFYLLSNVQGIVSEAHAAEIAAKIVPPDSTLHVVATSIHAHPELST